MLSDDDVREILRIIDTTPLRELRIETNGFKLHVLRGGQPATEPPTASERPGGRAEIGLVTIPAPMLGTFFRQEAPGEPPFVEVGSRVEPDTTVCIIEVMKMMNSVPAGVSGTIVEVCEENAGLVEYAQPLFRVQPE
jgi:acetyl-CoA carboxylase biotin carboxyl carrier protein